MPASALVQLLVAAVAAASLAQAAPTAGEPVLAGTVSLASNPLPGVSVVAYHLSSEQTFSAATDAAGRYRLAGLPSGYFDLAVRTPEGLFVANQVVNLASATAGDVSLVLQPDGSTATPGRERFFAGASEPTAGEAQVTKASNPKGGGFWSGPAGVTIIAGAGALTLLAIGGGSGSSSPFVP
jgi:hypothetical protein